MFLPSPEKPHLSLWLEAPDLLLAEIDLPKLVSASPEVWGLGQGVMGEIATNVARPV